MKTHKVLLLVAFLLTLTAATCGIRQDTSAMSARDAGALTILFSGGGDGPRRGGIFVEIPEGAPQDVVNLWITMPKLNCNRDTCADFLVSRPDGSLTPIGGIPRGQFDLKFTLADVTGRSGPVDASAGGPYSIAGSAYLQADDGEHRARLDGVIFVTVVRKGYTGVPCDGADVAWKVTLWPGCVAHYTTKMRTALCGDGCQDGDG